MAPQQTHRWNFLDTEGNPLGHILTDHRPPLGADTGTGSLEYKLLGESMGKSSDADADQDHWLTVVDHGQSSS